MCPRQELPYRADFNSPPRGPRDSPGLERPPTHSPEASLARGKVWNPRASRVPGLRGRSRFLKFPILMGAEKKAFPRRSLQAHAPTHIDVGGYMKGERKEGKEKAAGQKYSAFGGLHRPLVPCSPPAGVQPFRGLRQL
jgi:hypothetical protein